MTEAPPLVTIGLIAFNAADTVGRALDSALAQTWPRLEILVVDDASRDDTVSVLEERARENPAIRVLVNRTNGGASVARNRIIEEARGEFTVFFDDDDVSLPHRVTAQIERIRAYERTHANDDPVVCHAARTQHYPDGTQRIEPTMGQNIEGRAPAGPAVARRVLMGAPLDNAYGSCATCSQAARTSTYRDVGGFDPFFRRCQDTDICVRLARAGAHFVGIAEPLVTQTMTPTSDKGLELEHGFKKALLDKNRDMFETEEHFRFCGDWLELKRAWRGARKGEFLSRGMMLALRHPLRVGQRARLALPNLGSNTIVGRFYKGTGTR